MSLATAINGPWLILEDHLAQILDIAAREHEITPESLQKIEAEQMRRAERAKVRDGVAIIDVQGPLFKYANIMTQISGATSYEVLMRDLAAAVADPSIKAILLNVDSPGGHVSGCDELGQAIYAVRGAKPIEAYVSGVGASAAYWLATATDKVTISDATAVGSIGVIMSMTDTREAEKGRGKTTYQFVSSQSPDKAPDPATEPGRAAIQKTVDALAQVFVEAVAKHRGIKAEDVIAKFGGGGVEIGANAVKAGMADAVGQFEDVLAAMAKRGSRRSTPLNGGFPMSNTTTGGASAADNIDTDAIRAEAAKQATNDAMARVQAILGSDAAKATPKLANAIAFKTKLSAEDANALMAEAKADLDAAMPKADDKKQDDAADFFNKPGASIGIPEGQANTNEPKKDPWAGPLGRLGVKR